MNKTQISTTKAIYPQIYAYTLPTVSDKDGWVKIGYTERKDVNIRIKEQVGTADLDYQLLWYEMARFINSQAFNDRQLHHYLKKHKKIENKPNTEWFYYNGAPDKSLSDFQDFVAQNFDQASEQLDYQLRQEQQDATNQTLAYFNDNPDGAFLWNAKPRFGKTLTTYDLARRLNAQKVLIVTNRPAIANSWFDDFEKFIAWQTDFAFVSTADTLKDRPVLTRDEFINQSTKPNGKKSLIAFISLQDLKGAIAFGGQFDKLSWVKELSWDLLVIDEAHEGVATLKADVAFDNIDRKFTLHLSGTPFKALASGEFRQHEIYNWTYADEQRAKLQWDKDEHNPYEALPCLNLFSYQMSRMISDKVSQGADIDGKNYDFAFDLNEFFATDDKGGFIRKKEVEKWLDTLSKNEKYPFSTKELRDELKHTFWLLNRVDSAKALEKLLKNHPVFENYHVVLAVGDGRSDSDDVVSGNALDRVKNAIDQHDKTITLSVGQLTTGITIPEWTAVLMLSNIKSSALYWQAAFRAQNAWQYEKDGQIYQKQNAYVFDFAPERTLIIYDQFANDLFASTTNGGGSLGSREQNIRELLNFFPVIAEDTDGKMVELDVGQVLTIPKMIKAQEVVKKGFLSNLLFQNITGIFGAQNSEVLEILEQLNPVQEGKTAPTKSASPIDTQGVQVDDEGDAVIDTETIINTNNARFGEKIYGEITQNTDEIIANTENLNNQNLVSQVVEVLTQNTQNTFKALAKEHGVTEAFATKVVKGQSEVVAYEVQKIQKQSEIEQNTAKATFEKQLNTAKTDSEKQQIISDYQAKVAQISQNLQTQISEVIETKTKEFTQNSTEAILQKAEQNKQDKVEDDIRGRLRGFSRTIPSFLMAYGDKNITLANFDTHISDTVFKEVTGITLEQFRVLRDKHQFFDEQVFNTSVQAFLQKRTELANYFDEHQTEDIFNYIPPQKTNQVFTPKWVVKMMMDKFEQENPDIFKNPNITFADLYMKSGLYITEIVKRLYIGLESEFPNPKERLKHIFANQVYGFAPSKIIYNIAKNFITGFDRDQILDHSHIVQLDTTPYAKGKLDFNEKLKEIFGIENMKFDVIVGNPPYQESRDDTSDESVYSYFYELASQCSGKYCLISPARFLFNAGQTSKEWNERMLNDKHIKVVYFEQKSENVFSNTDIKGGISIVYRDKEKYFGRIGIFTAFAELNGIIQKVSNKDGFESIMPIIYLQLKFDLTKLYEQYPNLKSKIGSQGKEKRLTTSIFETASEIFYDEKQSDDDIEILGLIKNQRLFKFVRMSVLEPHKNLRSFKVILPKSNGSGAIGEALSTPLIGEPLIGYTQSFISIGNFNNRLQAENCLKYVKSKFARTMLGVLKVTQDNNPPTWANVPLQDFTVQSDIDWTQSIADIDKQLYAKYGLSDDEVKFIEEKVKAMV